MMEASGGYSGRFNGGSGGGSGGENIGVPPRRELYESALELEVDQEFECKLVYASVAAQGQEEALLLVE